MQKPPTLLVHDEIECVEFLRQGGTGMLASSAKTFDLSIRMQSSDQVSTCFFPPERKEIIIGRGIMTALTCSYRLRVNTGR